MNRALSNSGEFVSTNFRIFRFNQIQLRFKLFGNDPSKRNVRELERVVHCGC